MTGVGQISGAAGRVGAGRKLTEPLLSQASEPQFFQNCRRVLKKTEMHRLSTVHRRACGVASPPPPPSSVGGGRDKVVLWIPAADSAQP